MESIHNETILRTHKNLLVILAVSIDFDFFQFLSGVIDTLLYLYSLPNQVIFVIQTLFWKVFFASRS